ncbi:SEC23-interacting protein [Camellia lanceoleosa]|uniref:SEC23-interacting protein n=1 Tax=Camellia lanceoleosa TaxID=1840588 RepID=A0ACC0F973_9ERIC|nr:SEC23-interacting protein [Camellia lanceoleosa]
MYADRVEATSRRSIKERLYGNTGDDSSRRRQFTGKRQRQDDDKWEHDLYKDDEPQVSSVRDLREKLSGTMYSQPVNTDPPKPKRKPVLKDNKSVRNNVIVEAPEPETKKVASSVPRTKTQQKAESVDSFLRSLGLEKYSITFQVEEVDMTALVHMTGEDLKALGIPMGPRKKILLALESNV